jgi:hypothetical protein
MYSGGHGPVSGPHVRWVGARLGRPGTRPASRSAGAGHATAANRWRAYWRLSHDCRTKSRRRSGGWERSDWQFESYPLDPKILRLKNLLCVYIFQQYLIHEQTITPTYQIPSKLSANDFFCFKPLQSSTLMPNFLRLLCYPRTGKAVPCLARGSLRASFNNQSIPTTCIWAISF